MICPHCGRESDPLFKFCLHCGKELSGKKAPPKMPEKAPLMADKEEARGMAAPSEPKVDSVRWQKPAEAAPAQAAPGMKGAPAEVAPQRRCPRCRARLPSSATVCPLCGARVKEDEEAAAVRADEVRPTKEMGVKRKSVGFLISVSSVEGRETVKMPLKLGKNTLGRENCDLRFPEDDLLAPHHLTIEVEGDRVTLSCPGTRNGSFLRIAEPVKLEHGTQFRLGQQLLRYEELEKVEPLLEPKEPGTSVLGSPVGPNVWGRLTQVVGENLDGSSFLLTGESVYLGRERGNITFPGDRYVSGSHAVITRNSDGAWLRDVGSSNGTYVRLKGRKTVKSGQFFLAGRQLFKLVLEE